PPNHFLILSNDNLGYLVPLDHFSPGDAPAFIEPKLNLFGIQPITVTDHWSLSLPRTDDGRGICYFANNYSLGAFSADQQTFSLLYPQGKPPIVLTLDATKSNIENRFQSVFSYAADKDWSFWIYNPMDKELRLMVFDNLSLIRRD